MIVRIAAHAITAAALGASTPAAFAAEDGVPVVRARLVGPSHRVSDFARGHRLGIDHGSGPDGAIVFASEADLDAAEAAGLAVERLPAPPPAAGYRMPDEGDALLADIAEGGARAGLVVLGRSVEGRPILALWLGQPPESGAPAHRILGAHHGDEASSYEVALATARALGDGDGVDPAITALLDQATVWVAPYTNPDGVVAGQRWNANGVDINRNYGFEWSADEFLPGSAPFSEPEPRAIRAFSHWVQPILGLSLHSGASNFGWVWNHTRTDPPDADALEAQAQRYADHTSMPGFWITNGAAWYRTNGDTNDWSYGRHGVWDSTLELTEDKTPPAGQIPTFVGHHLPAMLDFVAILPDLSGRVLDATSGLPVDARVQLRDGAGTIGQPFRTEPGTGWFHRLTDGSPTDVEVSAPGYRTAVVPVDGSTVLLERDRLDARALLPAPVRSERPQLPATLDGIAVLSQPGNPTYTVPISDGILQIDPAILGGGAWSVERSDGVVHRHGLLVSDAVHARLDSVEPGTELVLSGAGFEEGARVWALFGAERARVPLPVLSQMADRIAVDASALDGVDGRIDVWILTGGEHLFASDILQTEPETWGMDEGKPELEGRACACSVKTGHLPAHAASWILTLLLLLFRRTS